MPKIYCSTKGSVFIIYFIFLLFILSTTANGQTINLPSDREARAKEATEARMAYSTSKDYDPYGWNTDIVTVKIEKQARKLMDMSEFEEAIAEAEHGLKADPFNVQLLIIKAAALRAMGRAEEADIARHQWIAIVDSILLSGDGRGFATAFKVISVAEEYALLAVMNLKRSKQSSVEHDGSKFDVLIVKDNKTGQESEIYFNVDIPRKKLAEDSKKLQANDFAEHQDPVDPNRPTEDTMAEDTDLNEKITGGIDQ